MHPPVIEARDLSFAYGERLALNHFSLSIPPGTVFGLLGPNGSGKSTFVTMLAAMDVPATGEISAFGEAPAAHLRARIGTVFQENATDPLMTVAETLSLAGRLFGMSRALIQDRSHELLDLFGLADRLHDATVSLSGGMRRRLEMCRALLHDPELLLLDEPTTGVDPEERRALWDALLARRDGRRTILLATNDLAEADTVCDLVAFVQAGHVVATGTPQDLKRGLKQESVRLEWPGVSAEQLKQIGEWAGTEIVVDGPAIRVTVDDAATFVPRLFSIANGGIRSVNIQQASLEDAYFRHVSGRSQPAEVMS